MNFRKLGVMLDCSRNAVMSVSGLKNFINVLSKMGYNRLLLYTEDTYEVKDEPLFGYMRGRYTVQELKEIDSYADSKGIELIPCIQTLAHLEQIFYWAPYRSIRDMQDTLLVDEERTYELIEHMFATCAEAYKARKIHIGMDEAHYLGLGRYLDKHGFSDRTELFLRHLNKVCAIAEKYGLKPMMWSDMFFHLAFNKYYTEEGEIPEWVRKKAPKNVELVYWDYYSETKELYSAMLEKHLSFDNEISFAGGAYRWGQFTPLNSITMRRTKLAFQACEERGIKDVMMTVWGDDGTECSVYAVLPSLLCAAEYARGNYDEDSIKRKFFELFEENFDDFCSMDINMPDKLQKQFPECNGVKPMFYNDPFLGKFDSTVLGTGEEAKAFAAFKKHFHATKKCSKNYAYLFEHYEKLCAFLEVKYDLGYRTRVAYQQNDKEALRFLIDDYKKAEHRLESFYQSFSRLWMKDNKAFGFEVQEIRIGGLKQRLESCRKRIVAYLASEIEKIDELEENLNDLYGGETMKKTLPYCCVYKSAATVGPL